MPCFLQLAPIGLDDDRLDNRGRRFMRQLLGDRRQLGAPRAARRSSSRMAAAAFLGRDETPCVALEAPFVLWLPSQSRGEFRLEAGGAGDRAVDPRRFPVWRTVGDSGAWRRILRPLLARIVDRRFGREDERAAAR